MATKRYNIGTTGPFIFDDNNGTIRAFDTDAPVRVGTPEQTEDALRLCDINDVIIPEVEQDTAKKVAKLPETTADYELAQSVHGYAVRKLLASNFV